MRLIVGRRNVIIAAVVSAMVAAIIAGLYLNRNDNPGPIDPGSEARELGSYRLEIRREHGEEPSILDQLPWLMYGGGGDQLHVWSEDGRTLWRMGFSDEALAGLEDVVLDEGGLRSSYRWAANTYTLDEPISSVFAWYPTVLGPREERSIDEFLQGSNERALLGEEQMLGRRVLVFSTEPLELLTDRFPSEKARVWIDPAYMFVLRYEFYNEIAGGERLYYRNEATRVDFNPDIAAGSLVLDYPPTARPEVDARDPVQDFGLIGPKTPADLRVPAGFLLPTVFPDGLSTIEVFSSVRAFQIWMGQPYDAAILVMQRFRFGGLPAQMKTGTPVAINGSEGFLTHDGPITRIVWDVGDVIVLVTSSMHPEEELLRVARGLELSP